MNVECKSTGRVVPESMARDIDELTKSLPSDCGWVEKAYIPEIQFEPGERAEVSIITAETVDKTNEVVLIGGIDFDWFRANPAILWNHQRNLPTIGECQWIKQHKSGAVNTLRAKSVYPQRQTKSEDTDRPFWIDQVWDLISCRPPVLKAKSIGFIPLRPKREPTADELDLHPEWKGAGIWDGIRLYEYSCCSVGICNDALLEAVNSKGFDPACLEALGIDVPEPQPAPEPPLWEVYKSDECVGAKIKHLYDTGEASKYSREQVLAIADAYCHRKAPPATTKAKALDMKALERMVEQTFAAALDSIEFDVAKLRGMVKEAMRSRGKV